MFLILSLLSAGPITLHTLVASLTSLSTQACSFTFACQFEGWFEFHVLQKQYYQMSHICSYLLKTLFMLALRMNLRDISIFWASL